MFIVVVTLGLLAGALLPAYLILRRQLRVGVVAFGVALLSILLLSLPATVEMRIGFVVGFMSGFGVAATVATAGTDEPPPSASANDASDAAPAAVGPPQAQGQS
jgi:hypothetical protein